MGKLSKKLIRNNSKSIGTRVLFLIILWGFFLALVEGGVHLYLDYESEILFVEEELQQIQNRYLKSITKSTWNLETDEVELQLEGALQLRDIVYMEVITEIGETLAAKGFKPSKKTLSRTFPLKYHHHDKVNLIGSLYVIASLEGVYQRLGDKFIVILLTRLLIALFMSGVFLIIFQHIVSRHLTRMAQYTQDLDLNNMGSPLALNRPSLKGSEKDELDKVVQAINSMQWHIQKDINEIKRAQDVLRREKEFTEAVLNSQQDTFFLFEIDTGKVIRWNRSFNDVSGYTDDEISQMAVPDDYYSTDDLDRAAGFIKKILKTGIGKIELNLICKSGQKVLTEYSVSVFKDDSGKSKYLIFMGRDITDRVQAEQAVKESEKKYRNIFESSIDAILLLDPEKGYIDCNPAAFELFGIQSKEQLIELTPSDLSPKYQADGSLSYEKVGKIIAKAMETGTSFFEWTHRRLGGEEFFASVLVTRVKIGGRVLLHGTIRDISEYKRTQEMMVQSEKMLSVGGLAAGMAHEINNPLAGLMQTADLMGKRLTDIQMPANQQAAQEVGVSLDSMKAFMEKRGITNMVTAIGESGRRIAEIVANMLSFARKKDFQFSSHLLSELIDKTLTLAATDFDLKKHYDFKTIKIIKEYDDGLPQVPCEAAKIQQVVLNILRNGAEAMQEAGIDEPMFTIRTGHEESQGMIRLEISDNGPGMDKFTVKRAFEPFFTTKPVGVGTGLGLSVSYFIITENHGGEMSVVSSPGKGAKFTIRLPLKRNQ